jgi:CBS domain-containing protein
MVVRDVMSFPAVTCGPSTLVAEAARLMSRHNCGCLLVTGDRGQLLGLVTDRDLALALATRPNTWGLGVRDAMTSDVESCDPETPVERTLEQFTDLGVRRLPVVDAHGRAQGLLSVDDLVLHAGESGLPLAVVFDALRAIAAAETGRAAFC